MTEPFLLALWEYTWPLLTLLFVLAGLRRLPPAGPVRRLMGGILLGLIGVRVLACETGMWAINDPNDDYAALICLGLCVFMAAKAMRMPEAS